MAADKFSIHMEAVARTVLGEPNGSLSSDTELRYGRHGSLAVDLQKGVWTDHEANTGGGVLDLLRERKGLKTGEALHWLREQVGADLEDRREPSRKPRLVATYDYIDECGEVLFQVCRFEPKTFRQRRPDPSDPSGWSWNAKGVRQVPYRLDRLAAAINHGQTVYVVEGEKDVEAMAREGLTATCNAMGAGKFHPELTPHFAGADVVILPDNDDAGRAHARVVSDLIGKVAKRVRVLELPDLPPKGDVSDWLAMGGDGKALASLVEEWTPGLPKSRFGAIRWADMDRVQVIYPPLVKGLIYQGDTGMFFGESGSGKSFLAVDMGLAIARGVPFLGMKTAKGAVLYQAGEGGKGLLKRLKAYRQHHMVASDLPFILLPEKVNLFSEDGDTEAFIAECLAWKAALSDPLHLIVIDTFSAASTGANENASEDMGRMLDAGYRLNKATGAAVVWVHHKNAGGLRERGHTSFRANIETVVEVTKDPETKERALHLVKLKDGEDGLRIGFELQAVTLGSDDDGDPITSCVVKPAQLGSAQPGQRYRLPKGQHDFLKVLDTAISQWGGVVPGSDVYGVDREALRELYQQICGFGKEPDAVRQAWARASKDLLISGLIGHKDRWVWITEKGGQWL